MTIDAFNSDIPSQILEPTGLVKRPTQPVNEDTQQWDELRSSPRINADVVVDLWVNSEVHDPGMRTANISVDGMFVTTQRPLPVGTMTLFRMNLPSGNPVSGFAEVTWIRPYFESADRPSGMGLYYVAVGRTERSHLRRFVNAASVSADGGNAKARVRERTLLASTGKGSEEG